MSTFPTSVIRTPHSAADYAAAGRPLSRREFYDQTDTGGAKAIFDFASLRGRPGGKEAAIDPIAGTPCLSLVPNKPSATVMKDTIGYAGGGLLFPASATTANFSQYVDLTPIQIQIGDVLIYWVKGSGFAQMGNNRLAEVGTALTISPSANSSGACTIYEVASPNATSTVVDSATLRAALTSNAVHQIAHAFVATATSGNYQLRTYLDGALVFTGAEYAFGTPAAGTFSYGGRTALGNLTGSFYRAAIHNTGLAGVSADALVSNDYAVNRGRLVALSS